MIQLKSKNFPLVYSIHRTENLKQLFKTLKQIDLSYQSSVLVEHAIDFIALINGKHRTLLFPYCVREKTSIFSANTLPRTIEVVRNYKTEYKRFVALISLMLSNKCGYSIETSQKFVYEAMECFLKYKKNRNFYNNKSVKRIKNMFFSFIQIISQRIYDILTKNNYRLLFSNPKPKSPYYNEFKKINKLILSHRKNIRRGIGNPKPKLSKLLEITKIFPSLFWRTEK
ncbi:unnamed protein product, partial [marine sediment metagenome]